MATRTEIFAYVKAQLKTIKLGSSVTVKGTAYAYQTDIGRSIFPWRTSALGEKEKSDLTLRDEHSDRVDDEQGEFGLDKRNLRIPIEIRRRGKSTDAIAWIDKVITDLTALIISNPRLGGLARWSQLDQETKDLESHGTDIASIALVLTVTYVPGPGEA